MENSAYRKSVKSQRKGSLMEKHIVLVLYIGIRAIAPDISEILGIVPLEDQMAEMLKILSDAALLHQLMNSVYAHLSRFRSNPKTHSDTECLPDEDSQTGPDYNRL